MDEYIYDGKGKLELNEMIMEAIQFGIEKETPKLLPNEKIVVSVNLHDDKNFVEVNVQRKKK
tara:strand:+ start:79 stop:264 length:186 start_codon:yes stop_codon:yes gene_type:complete